MLTTIGMHYDVLPGKEQQFKDAFKNVITHLQAVTGHLQSSVFENVDQAGSFLILSQWQTKADFEAFIHSQAFKDVTNWGKTQILRNRPTHKVYSHQ